MVPNAITVCRLLATPVLLAAALERRPTLFAWVLLGCLASDIADGLLARALKLQSPFGAALDSAADLLVTIIAAIGTVTMQGPSSPRTHGAVMPVRSCRRDRHLPAPRHCRASTPISPRKHARGAFLLALLLGLLATLFYLMWIIACVAQLEEWTILAILPDWRSDVRGIYWVLKARRP